MTMTEPTIPEPEVDRVLALVLNWNGAADTLDCLDSLKVQTHCALDVLVLDNGSTDDSVTEIRTAWPDLELVATGVNLGYAGGNNVGLRIALERRVPFVLVLNNDTVLEPDCVESLVRAARAHSEAAALSPKSFIYERAIDQPRTIYCAGGGWDGTGYPRMIGFREPDGPAFARAREVEWLNGCAILLRREALERIGLFDERFFHTFEDTDWSLRARRAGWTLRVEPAARLAHRISRSLGSSQTPAYLYYYTRNHLLFAETHFRGLQRVHATIGVLVRGLRALRRTARKRPAHAPAVRRAMAQGVSDYLARRFGERSPRT